ncbi:Phosphorylated carbohydrates phosphatase [compost metagenome]
MRCVLFDLDGTIADTEILKAKALSLTVRKLGGEAEPGIYKEVMGQTWEIVTGAFLKHAGLNISLDVFNPIFREKYSHLIDIELKQKVSVVDFLNYLKSKEILIGLVSSASPWMIQKALTKLNLENRFNVIVSNADTDRHKPHPEAYLIALDRLGSRASEAIAFEDSESGFQAAASAKLSVYGIRHEYNVHHSFQLCHRTIESFADYLEWDNFHD